MNAAKSMLVRESLDAIQFYVKDGDPLLLVDNLQYQGPKYQNEWRSFEFDFVWIFLLLGH